MVVLFAQSSFLKDDQARKQFERRIALSTASGQIIVASEDIPGTSNAWTWPGPARRLDLDSFLSREADGKVDMAASRARCAAMHAPVSPSASVRCTFVDAVVLAACLDCGIEVMTDSRGAFQADPAIVPEALELDNLSFEEAAELSRFTRSGLDQAIAGPVARYRVPATIMPAGCHMNGSPCYGTRIGAVSDSSLGPIKAMAAQDQVSMVSVTGTCLPGTVGIAARVFDSVSRAGVSVLLISQSSSEYSICFCIQAGDEAAAIAAINSEFTAELAGKVLDPVNVICDLAILTTIGDGMRKTKGIAGRCFTQLARADVNIVAIAQGSSERSISAVVDRQNLERGVRMIYQAFFDSSMPIDLIVAGCGNVGSALLAQIAKQSARLSGLGVRIRLIAVANSRRMVVDRNGLDPAKWKNLLDGSGRPMSMGELTALGPELSNPVLVDCSASETVPGEYPAFILAGFNIVTPNKHGNSGSMERYLALKQLALRHRRLYLYETTVGAGLPVIGNLQNLLHAGDSLESFSGILSGSLSFLFGRLEEGISFSAAVHEAMERGLTEPDPRDDLAGTDVARKVLIIARESGLSLELKDIALAGLVPEEYLKLGKAEFIARMPELDGRFEAMQKAAAADGKVLRFVGSIDSGKGKAGLLAVGPGHPLFAVKGGENALAFSTRYYSPVPLLLRGYGAGSEVTAAGVFSDILRTLNWIREA